LDEVAAAEVAAPAVDEEAPATPPLLAPLATGPPAPPAAALIDELGALVIEAEPEDDRDASEAEMEESAPELMVTDPDTERVLTEEPETEVPAQIACSRAKAACWSEVEHWLVRQVFEALWNAAEVQTQETLVTEPHPAEAAATVVQLSTQVGTLLND